MATVTVNNTTELLAALSSASGGDIIECVQGSVYAITSGSWSFASEVIVRSQDPANPAQFSNILMSDAQNITFQDLYCFYQHTSPTDGLRFEHTFITRGTNINLERCDYQTTRATQSYPTGNGGDQVVAGYGTGKAIVFSSSIGCQAIDNRFDLWWSAVFINSSNGPRSADNLILGCDFSRICADCIALGSSDDSRIAWNWFHDFENRGLGSAAEHRDAIQIRGASGGVTRPLIEHNIIDIAGGGWAQGIFSGGDGRQQGTPSDWHIGVIIRNNIVYISDKHGITLNQVDGATIGNNTLIKVPTPPDQTGGGTNPRINIENGSTNVDIDNNVTNLINYSQAGTNNVETGNLIIDPTNHAAEYDQLRTGAVHGYNQWPFKSGGTAFGSGKGAPVHTAYPFDNLTWIRSRGASSIPVIPAGGVSALVNVP